MKITEILPCSSDLSPSQQSSSLGDLRPEMIESETPPPAVPSYEAGDPEVSSRRVSPNPAGLEGSRMAPPRPSVSGLRKRASDESGTVWCTVGGAEGSARASVYLRRTLCVDEHGDWKDLIRGKRIVRGRQEFTDRF